MQEGKRQRQIAGLIEEKFSDIFRRLGLTMMNGGMVSISSVKVTPDLLEARIYLSFYHIPDTKAALKKIEDRAWEIKKEFAGSARNQLRRIPVFHFYVDDTLDQVDKMEQLFKEIQSPPAPEGEL